MKNFTLSLLTFVLSCTLSYTNAQCPPGEVNLLNQAQVDAFRINYPNCTQVSGNLNIGSLNNDIHYNIYDLSGLENINTITGGLLIANANSLTNTHGLDQLARVDGNIRIFYNDNIQNLTGFGSLNAIGGDLRISGNSSLTAVGGLQDLTDIGGDMEVSDNDALPNFSAFDELTTVGGYLSIWGNQILENVDELTKLSSIGDNLIINQNDLLENLSGLQSLETVGADFSITQNPNLVEIGDLNPTIQASAMLRIALNFSLSECAVQVFCSHISNNGGVEIVGNGEGCSSVIEIENSCASTLPVELSDFYAEIKDRGVLLTWQTLTENNNEGFDIQRSRDGLSWESIGWEAGQGDSETAQKYTFTDNRPALGKSYYRLAQSDFDGKIEYSPIVTVSFYRDVVSVYPNPVSDVLKITVADDMAIESVTVYTASGREVMHETNITDNLNVSRLHKGAYIVAIQVNGETIRQKIVVE